MIHANPYYCQKAQFTQVIFVTNSKKEIQVYGNLRGIKRYFVGVWPADQQAKHQQTFL